VVKTAKEIRIIDQNCVELGMHAGKLMENAGAAAAKIIQEKYPQHQKVAICCGTGNNGGDGFVIARHLASIGSSVTIYLLGHPIRIRSDIASQNFNILKQMEQSIRIVSIRDSTDLKEMAKELQEYDLIVDALLGIGLNGEPYEPIKTAIKAINKTKKPIISADIPSGMFSDKKEKTKIMVKADLITTFHDTKPCLTIKDLAEKTIICPIGVPPEAEIFIGIGDLKTTFPKRKSSSHKGENGMVLVIGGSKKYSGAPILTARAALRTGVDLVLTCLPSSIAKTGQADSPNLIIKSFSGANFKVEHAKEIIPLIDEFDSIVLGPGLGTTDEIIPFVQAIVQKIPPEKKLIIDADGLKAVKDELSILKNKSIILTPHAGEYKQLFQQGLPTDWQERMSPIKQQAEKRQITLLVKGEYDIISDGRRFKVNRTGHEGMTVGGTGDVLAGIVGAIAAIQSDTFCSAAVGAYLSGKAGEYAAKDFGNSLLATDVIDKIAEVLTGKTEFHC
jgi:NAD(P)H-hydrate epimerase